MGGSEAENNKSRETKRFTRGSRILHGNNACLCISSELLEPHIDKARKINVKEICDGTQHFATPTYLLLGVAVVDPV